MRRSPSETWMFSVVFWILWSWLPCLADWEVSCSRYVVQLQQNICHQNDCEHEWQSTFSPKRTWGSEQNFLRRDEYRRPDSQVLCLIALGIPSWSSWIQPVVWPATNEVDAVSVWCVRDVSLLWSVLQQHSAPTVLAPRVCRSLRTANSCSSPGDMKRTPVLVSL